MSSLQKELTDYYLTVFTIMILNYYLEKTYRSALYI